MRQLFAIAILAAAVLAAAPAHAVKICDLTDGTAVADTDYFELSRNCAGSRKIAATAIASYVWAEDSTNYLVGTATANLANEIAVGTTPGGELGNTWASPTLDDSVTVATWIMTGAPGLTVSNGASTAGAVGFVEDSDNGSNVATLRGPSSTADVTITLPAATDTLVGKATTDSFTNKTIDADGTGNSISNIENADIKAAANIAHSKMATALRTIWVPASSIQPSASGGSAALALIASAANQPDISSLNFDATTAEYAQFSVRMPKGWNASTVTAAFVWSHPSTTTNFGVRWGLQGVSIADNEAMAVAYGTAQEVTDTGGTTDRQYISGTTSAITIAGTPATGEVQYFRVYRLPTDAADTMAVDARLQGVILFYTVTTMDDT